MILALPVRTRPSGQAVLVAEMRAIAVGMEAEDLAVVTAGVEAVAEADTYVGEAKGV